MGKSKSFKVEDILSHLRKGLSVVLYISIVCEMFFFPSIVNLAGCMMSLVVWNVFRFSLKRHIVINHPFSFLVYVCLFLARYLPLPATLIEGKPISWKFQVGIETFLLETILFIVCSAAFYLVVNKGQPKNSKLQLVLHKFRFFESNVLTLWLLGAMGFFIRIITLSLMGAEKEDVGAKFLDGFKDLQYAPLLLLFPTLTGLVYKNKMLVWSYVGLLMITSLATNSRQAMIFPIFTVALLFFLFLVKENVSIFRLISPLKLVLISVFLTFGLQLISDVSLSMIYNRHIRRDISSFELFSVTLETVQNRELINSLRNASLEKGDDVTAFVNGSWDETYLDNFMMNRFANLRTSDLSLYYAERAGYGNEKMREVFFDKFLAIFPTPVLNMLGIDLDKKNLGFSPGDMLYFLGGGTNAVTLGGYRTTSLIADGLVTFSYFCFAIIFILFFLTFKLLDCFVFYNGGKVAYATIALISIFGIFGMCRNSIGCINLVTYLLRGFWQNCFIFLFAVFMCRTFKMFLKK